MDHEARYWHLTADGRVQCDLCPRECRMRAGQRGVCFVRANQHDSLVLTGYGRSSGFRVDPIERTPLNHFLPGTDVLSFGTVGCNLSCKFCRSSNISMVREPELLTEGAEPEQIAAAALAAGCQGVAYTHNDPIIYAEYAIDVAREVRRQGLVNVAATAAYVNPDARADFFAEMDAVCVDLKGFSDSLYQELTGGRLAPVLDTISHVAHHTDVWLELSCLLIPGHNDASSDLRAMCRWIVSEVGPDVPVHFTAFQPGHRMRDLPPTPPRTLIRARMVALEAGLRHVYADTEHDPDARTTLCPNCRSPLISRAQHRPEVYQLDAGGACVVCGTRIAGRFAATLGDSVTRGSGLASDLNAGPALG